MGYQDRMRDEGASEEEVLAEVKARAGKPAGAPIRPTVGLLPEEPYEEVSKPVVSRFSGKKRLVKK